MSGFKSESTQGTWPTSQLETCAGLFAHTYFFFKSCAGCSRSSSKQGTQKGPILCKTVKMIFKRVYAKRLPFMRLKVKAICYGCGGGLQVNLFCRAPCESPSSEREKNINNIIERGHAICVIKSHKPFREQTGFD